MISPESVEKFRIIYKAEFGAELTFDEAAEQAERFLNLTRIVMQPMPKQYLTRYNELKASPEQTTE